VLACAGHSVLYLWMNEDTALHRCAYAVANWIQSKHECISHKRGICISPPGIPSTLASSGSFRRFPYFQNKQPVAVLQWQLCL
jgi:hypothetical protein